MCIYSRRNPPSGYYVYLYLREDGTPYYAGKGKDDRAWVNHGKISVPEQNRIEIVASDLSELWAFALERKIIRWYGRKDINTGILRNRTDGGEGSSGRSESEELRKYRSKTRTGVPRPDMIGNKLAVGQRKKTEEHQRKITESLNTKEVNDRMRAAIKNACQRRPVIACPHCGLNGKGPNMTRYHFDNCKGKNNGRNSGTD